MPWRLELFRRANKSVVLRTVVSVAIVAALWENETLGAAVQRRAEADQFLARARKAAGGTVQLDAVKSLELRYTDRTLRVLLPNRFQTIFKTPYYDLVTTLDGDTRWALMTKPGAPAQIVPSTPEAVENERKKLENVVLCNLLRPWTPKNRDPRFLGDGTFAGVSGTAVQFGDNGPILVFEGKSARLEALLTRSLSDRGTPATTVARWRDFRPTQNLVLPYVVDYSQYADGQSKPTGTLTITEILVNPPLKPADFARPKDLK
jgi:hypothetical protein